MTPLSPGETIAGRYRVERLLARGGMGAVYIAEQIETEQRVALKILLSGVSDGLERFRQEAKLLGRLTGDHIVRVVDAGVDEAREVAFIAMELLEGETLEARLERDGPMDASMTVQVLAQTAIALDRAHGQERAIVHRDLKPENLFLTTRSDGALHVKVLDFGIAKITSATANVSTEIRGTPLYMAIEQIEAQEVTPRTDIASLGLIAFRCLAGRPYWKTALAKEYTLATLLREILKGTPTRASDRARELDACVPPSPFDPWFARCTAVEPAARFETAGAAIRELGQALDVPVTLPVASARAPSAEPIVSATPTALAATRPWPNAPKRSSSRFYALVAALVVVAIALVIGRGRLAKTERERTQPVVVDGPPLYREALAAFRDGQESRWTRLLRKVVDDDPTFAPALLRLAFACHEDCVPEGRTFIARAAAHRDRLSSRDLETLAAFEVFYAKEPLDSRAFADAMAPLAKKYPSDLEIGTITAKALQVDGRLDAASGEVNRVLALDPTWVEIWRPRASIEWSRGNIDEMKRVGSECLDQHPRATMCLHLRQFVDAQRGICDEYEADSRRWMAIDYSDETPFWSLASVLAARGKPRPVVEAVMVQALERDPPAIRYLDEVTVRATIDEAFGRFDEAEAGVNAYIAAHPQDLETQGWVSEHRMRMLAERGDRAGAVSLAKDVAAREETFPPWFRLYQRPHYLVEALGVGAIDRSTFDREVADSKKRVPALLAAEMWAHDDNDRTHFTDWTFGESDFVASTDDARAALARFDEKHLRVLPVNDEPALSYARTLQLAGRTKEAEPFLASAAANCDLLGYQALRIIRASLWLGQAREANGDTRGACEAYAKVLHYWGEAKKSLTADEARARSKALVCAN